MNTVKGKLIATDMTFGIIVARFNEFMVKGLLEGALNALNQHGANEKDITIVWVPGAFEIPLIAREMAESGKYDAVVCLGAVIRGDTPHFEYVCGPVASSIANVSIQTGVPIMFGVLTTENIEQTIERSGCKAGNKGYDVTVGAIEVIDVLRQIRSESRKGKTKK